MSLDMLLQILGTLEGFPAEIAFVRFKWHVNTDMRGNVISLHSGCPTATPLASEV